MCLYSTSSSYCISYTETLYIIIFWRSPLQADIVRIVCSFSHRQSDNARTTTAQYTIFVNTHRRARDTTAHRFRLDARSAQCARVSLIFCVLVHNLYSGFVCVRVSLTIFCYFFFSSVDLNGEFFYLWLFSSTGQNVNTDHEWILRLYKSTAQTWSHYFNGKKIIFNEFKWFELEFLLRKMYLFKMNI